MNDGGIVNGTGRLETTLISGEYKVFMYMGQSTKTKEVTVPFIPNKVEISFLEDDTRTHTQGQRIAVFIALAVGLYLISKHT